MVEQRHAEDVACGSKSLRQSDVVRRRRRIAGRVIVAGDDRGGVREYRGLEHLAWLCSGYGYVVQPLESQRRASLTVHGRNIISPALSIATDPVGASL